MSWISPPAKILTKGSFKNMQTLINHSFDSDEGFLTCNTNHTMQKLAFGYVDSKDPDQPANSPSLITTFPVYKQNHWIL